MDASWNFMNIINLYDASLCSQNSVYTDGTCFTDVGEHKHSPQYNVFVEQLIFAVVVS